MAFTSGNDINILQGTDTAIVGAGAGDDIYIVSPVTLTAGQVIDVSDAQGTNTLQLIGGLTIASSVVVSNALQLTLSNGAVINVNGADTFNFNVGGNAITGDAGVDKDFETFAEEDLGVTVPAEGEPSVAGGPVEIGAETGEFTLTADADAVDEGATAAFNVENGESNFTYSYEISGVDADDVDGDLTGTVTTDADGNASIGVALAADRTTEGEETLTVSLTNTGKEASVIVNDVSLDNVAPVAEDAAVDVAEADAAVAGQLAATDAEDDALTFTLDAPVDGLTLNADGSYTFDPAANPAAQALTYVDDNLVIAAAYTVTDALGATDQKTLTITVTPTPLTFELTTAVSSVEESVTQTFTVEASEALAADTDVTFTLLPGDGLAANAGTNDTNTADFDTGSFNPQTVTIAAGDTTASFEVVPSSDATTELPESFTVQAEVEGDDTYTLDGTVVDATTPGAAGQTFTLTTGIDTIPGLIGSENSAGTDGDDTIIGVLDATDDTLSPLDSIDGGLGDNTLRIDDLTGAQLIPGSATITNVQTVNLRSDGDVGAAGDFFDTTDIGGLTEFNVTVGEDIYVKSAATTAIDVSGAAGGDGGAGEAEVFTATFADNGDTDTSTITFDGVTVTMAGSEADDTAVATKFATDYNADGSGSYTAVDNGDGTVTFTANNTGVVADVVADDFVVALAGVNDVGEVDVTGVTVDTQGVDGGAAVISADGGSTQNLTAESADYDVISNNAAGAVTVTHEDQGLGTITVNDGTDVMVTSTSDSDTNAITVGGTDAPTGTVTITQNLNSEGDALTGGAITTTGGTTVDVTVNGTIEADEAADDGNTLTAGDITVNGDGNTTDVTVTQNLTATDFAGTTLSDATTETAVVTFGALNEGEAVVIGETANADETPDGNVGTELTFVASKNLTAEEVAAAFAELTNSDIQAAGGIVENGYFLGDLDAGWTSAAADGDTVTFTATAAGAIANDLAVGTNADTDVEVAQNDATNDADFDIVITQGADAVAGEAAADVGVAVGAVTVTDEDAGDAGITTVTIDGYAASTIEADALETLNLANSSGAMDVDTTATSLDFTVNGVAHAVDLGAVSGNDVATLNLMSETSASTFALDAAAVTDLTIDAGAALDLAGSDWTALTDVEITGSAAVDLDDDINAAALDSFDASANTGGVTAEIDADNVAGNADAIEEFLFSAGADAVTLVDKDVTVDIFLNGGNDTLTFLADSTTVPTGVVDGGDDTDTVSMTDDSAASFDNNTQFAEAVTGFERLTINSELAGAADINLETLGFTDYVTTTGTAGVATLSNLATGGTVVLAGAATTSLTVDVKDAATTADDELNVVLNFAGDLNDLIVADVETINIDVDANANALDLMADSTTTVNVAGGNDLVLDLDGSTEVTLVDASTMTGDLTLVADGAAAGTEVLGGSGTDTLTADGENDVLRGNDGADILTAGDLTHVYGGDGADIFNFNTVSNYTKTSVVQDVGSGDVFNLVDNAAGIVDAFYADGAQYNPDTTTDILGKINASVVQTGEGEATWFNHGDNTFIVIDGDDAENLAAGEDDIFVEGVDNVIQIAGVFDLSTDTSFNATYGTLEFV